MIVKENILIGYSLFLLKKENIHITIFINTNKLLLLVSNNKIIYLLWTLKML